jgi:hypothetical protein
MKPSQRQAMANSRLKALKVERNEKQPSKLGSTVGIDENLVGATWAAIRLYR